MKKITNPPQHVGIILDGNGRWAKKRNLPRLMGHKKGVETVREIVNVANENEIKALSLFAFSTENWKRPKEEVVGIFNLLENYLDNNSELFHKKNLKLRIMGDLSKLNPKIAEKITNLIEKTKNNTGLVVNIGLNYGGRDEILHAIDLCLKQKKDKIIEKDFEKNLYSAGLPPLDFVIRTGGDQRISNFMLYQIAYSELYFPKTFWPAFTKKHFLKALKVYSKRNRRFGNI